MYGIWCVRTSGSIFGPAEAWMKDEAGNRTEFAHQELAQHSVAYLNSHTRSPHVRYEARAIKEDG
jgi:hypothetical protein